MLPADSPFASPAAPGPHPATAELRAYAAGTLGAADEHRIEAHSLDCARCAELLTGFSMSDAATTNQALAGLRARLQTRVANDLAAPRLRPASRPLWPRLAAGVALLGAVGAGIWGWEHQPPMAATAPIASPAAPAQAPGLRAAAPAANESALVLPPALPHPLPPPRFIARVAVPVKPEVPAPPVCGFFRRGPDTAAVVVPQPAGYTIAANDKNGSDMAAPRATLSQDARETRAAEPAAAVTKAADAPPTAVAATLAKAAALADTAALAEAIASTFSSKAKSVDNQALVRVADKPMPAAIAIAPAPAKGTPALRNYLRREAADFELEEGAKPMNGMVHLRFVVEADGRLNNIQVVRGMRADYDEEALRMICEGPAWRPGIAGGRRAPLPVEITVSF